MVKAEVFGPGTYDTCANKVKKLTGILLIFHPGCGHCVQMRPEWEHMKRNLSPNTRVMEIDGSEMAENQNLKRAPFVKRLQGFPTLLRMKNGEPVDEFKGQRTSMEMKNFFEKGMSKKRAKTRRKKGLRKTMKRKKM